MLSPTYTIPEVKKELLDFCDYGYGSDTSFEDELKRQSEKVYYSILYPRIGSEYENIQTISDGSTSRDDFLSTLSFNQQLLFFAEVYYICSYFLKFEDGKENQAESSDEDSFSIEGYSQSSGGGSTSSSKGKTKSSAYFYNEGNNYMNQAGCSMTNRLFRDERTV